MDAPIHTVQASCSKELDEGLFSLVFLLTLWQFALKGFAKFIFQMKKHLKMCEPCS